MSEQGRLNKRIPWPTMSYLFSDGEQSAIFTQLSPEFCKPVLRKMHMAHPGQDLRQVIELSPISIYLLSPEGCFHLVNQRLVDLVGFTREELLGSHFSRLIYPFDRVYSKKRSAIVFPPILWTTTGQWLLSWI